MLQQWWANPELRTRAVLVVAGLAFVLIVVALFPRGDATVGGASSSPRSSASPGSTVSAASPTPPASAAATVVVTPAPTPQPTAAPAEPTARPAPVPVPAPQRFGSGTRTVGVDLAPGTYRTRTAAAGCSWSRLNRQGVVITGRSTDDPDIVTVLSTDGFFRTANCAEWTLDLTRITNTPLGAFTDGTFLVGTDVAPGIWRSSSQGCTWWRLSEFTGDGSTVVATGTPITNATVTIVQSDRGFRSVRCGLWSKVG